MTYETILVDCTSKTRKMAAAIETTANERARDGWELVTFSMTNADKAILVSRVPGVTDPRETATESGQLARTAGDVGGAE